jgi:alpha/beta superfamily hydrolase
MGTVPASLPAPERLMIEGPAGPLEAVVEDPTVGSGAAVRSVVTRFAIVCHPHSLHGGTLDNKVTHTLARTLQELGLATLRFNFRGVGHSGGVFDDGPGESEDVLSVAAWARRRWPAAQLWLAGFSFGGYVALLSARRARAVQLITVAPAIGSRFGTSAAIPLPGCPWLIVQGDSDELVDAQQVRAMVAGLQPAPTLTVLPGVEHFFHGHLPDLKRAVLAGLPAQQLPITQ